MPLPTDVGSSLHRRAEPAWMRHFVAALLACAALACGDSTTGPDGKAAAPTVLQPYAGDQQQATAGTALATPLVVEVLGAKGQPIGGATVTFAVTAGSGSVEPASAITNVSGQARTTFTLGPAAGAQTVTATVDGLKPITFTATANAGAATRIVATGDAQTGTAGDLLAGTITLRVVDALGNGIAGVALTAAPATGSGAFGFNAQATDANGNVTGLWRLGDRPGTHHVTVSPPQGSLITPLTLVATATAGLPDTVTAVGGDAQTAETGDQLATPVTVRVVDHLGNPVPKAAVTFTADLGGSAAPATVSTDTAGRASATWTLGTTAGAEHVVASVSGLGGTPRTRQFSASALAPSPATMWVLDHDVVDAEYSASADVIVTVSASPSRLNIINPASKTVQHVDLSQVPLTVSVDPAGTHAAVSHDGLISYVNLTTATVEHVYPITSVGGDIVLGGNGYVYVFPRSDQWVNIHCVNLSTGVETQGSYPGPYAGTVARLDPSGSYLYAATNNLTPTSLEKYDIRAGTPTTMYGPPSQYWGQYEPSGNLWISQDGTRITTRGAIVYRDSPVQSQDMTYVGSLAGMGTVQGAVQNTGSTRLYVIGSGSTPTWSLTPVTAPDVRAYDTQYLAYKGSVTLPRFKVPSGSGTISYASNGRFLFENTSGTRVYSIIQAPSGSGIAQSWAVATFNVSDLP